MNERRRVLLQSFPCPLSNSDYRHVSASKRAQTTNDKSLEQQPGIRGPFLYLVAEAGADVGVVHDAFWQQLR
jgi:hypothetical protein